MRSKLSLIIIVGLALAACGQHLDTAKADAALKAWAESNIAPVKQVTCPDTKIKKGTTLECKVDFVAGPSFQVVMDVISDDGDVEYHWAKPISSGDKLAASITAAVKKDQGKDIQLDCGKGIFEIPPDGVLCAATEGAQHGHLRVKFDPKAKDVVWTVEP